MTALRSSGIHVSPGSAAQSFRPVQPLARFGYSDWTEVRFGEGGFLETDDYSDVDWSHPTGVKVG
jgi:hypothetical protein